MPSTGQPSSNRSLVGNTRYSGAGNPFVPGNRNPSPAMRNSLVDRQEAQAVIKTADQLGLGDGVMVAVDHLTNVATASLKSVIPDVLNQLRELGASASKLLSGASSRMAGTSGNRSNSGSVASTTPGGVFSARKAAVSGNGGGVLATVADQARVTTYTVTVSQTAAGQTTTSGGVVNTDTNTSPITGSTSLTITTGGTTTTITPDFSTVTSNLGVLQAIATAVNAAGTPVAAQVVSTGGSSKLALTHTSTGSSANFTTGGNISNVLGFTTTTPARDSSYTLNGSQQTSTSNVVQLDLASTSSTTGRVQLYLQGPTASAVTISVGVAPNITAVVDATRDLANKFNAFLEKLAANPSLLSPGLAGRLQGAVDGLKPSLQSLGLALGANGALQLSENKLREALATNPTAVENVLGGPGGFASRIAAITRAVQMSPEILTTLAQGQDNTPYSSAITQADRLETRGAKRLLDFRA